MRDDALNAAAEINARLRQFFGHDRLMSEGSASAAVFLGHIRKQEAGLARQLPGFHVRTVLLAPLGLEGHEFLLYKLADGLAVHPQFFIHPRRFVFGHRLLGCYPSKYDIASALP